MGLLLLGTGCAAPLLVRRNWRGEEGVETLLRRSVSGAARLEDLKAEAGIAFRDGAQKGKATASILFKRPELFRVEVRGPFFRRLFTAVLEADSLIVVNREGAWKGGASGPLLEDMTGMHFGFYDFKYALLGLIDPALLGVRWSAEYPRADRALATAERGFFRRRLWADLFRGFVTREEIADRRGEVLWERRLRAYRQVGDFYLPQEVEIRQGEVELKLKYRSYTVNEGVAERLFFSDIPLEGLRRVE